MKNITYTIDVKYEKKDTTKIAGILFSILLKIVKKLKDRDHKYTNKEFAIFPVNMFQISKLKKIVMAGNGKGIAVLDAIDELFLEQIQKENLKIYREQFIK
jgi:hypothetical protein